MTNLLSWWNSLQLPPTTLPVAVVCSVCGALVLALYMRWTGLVMLAISGVILFIGAYFGNLLTANIDVSVDRLYVKPIIASFIGMAVAALFLLALFPKHRNT